MLGRILAEFEFPPDRRTRVRPGVALRNADAAEAILQAAALAAEVLRGLGFAGARAIGRVEHFHFHILLLRSASIRSGAARVLRRRGGLGRRSWFGGWRRRGLRLGGALVALPAAGQRGRRIRRPAGAAAGQEHGQGDQAHRCPVAGQAWPRGRGTRAIKNRWIQFRLSLETHAGKGISASLFCRSAARHAAGSWRSSIGH